MKNDSCSDLYEIVRIVEEKAGKGTLDLSQIKKYLNGQMSIRMVPKDSMIAKKENTGKYVYFIMEGDYFHYRISKQGKMDFLSNEAAPQWMDIGNVIAAQYANPTEDKTLGPCIVLDIKADYFLKCVKENGEFALKIIENLLIKMAKISCESDKRLLTDSRERLLMYLLETWNERQNQSGICRIDEKKEDIADTIGISIRTLYRILKELQDQEIVEINLNP